MANLSNINNKFLVTTGGNVGINSTSPGEKLEVDGNIQSLDTIYIKNASNGVKWQFYRDGSETLNFRYNNGTAWNSNAISIKNNNNVGIGTDSPQRMLDVRGDGLSIYGSGGNTELMLRGQVEGTGTVRNLGSWHWSVRGDVGGNNDDLKLLRFVTGTYNGITMQIGNSDGVATFYSKIIAPQLSIQNQINTTSSNLEFNFQNGDGTTTNFKDFYIRDGKNGVILNIQGSSKISNFLGNVKITTSGYPLLDIGISSSNYFRIIHDNPGDRLTIGKNAAASLIINGNGNVSTAGLLTPTSLDTNTYLSNGYAADLHGRYLGQAIYGSGTGGGDNYGTVADVFRYKDIAVWRKNSSTNAWSNPSTGNTLVQGNYAHKWGGINMEPAYSEYVFYFSNSLGYSFVSQTIVQHSTNGNSFDLYLQRASSTTNPYDSAGWTTMVTQTGISSWPGITCIQSNWEVGGGYPGLFRIRLVPSWNNGNPINIGSFQAYGSYGNFAHAWTTLFDRSVNFQSKIGVGTDPSRGLDVTQTALIQGAGNVSAGTLALGPRPSGTPAWSTISGSHYNQSSGSGNGSGSGGIMMIGTYGGSGENDLYIGGGPYEINAATAIRFHTHTTDTSTVGGTERMRITPGGELYVGHTSTNPNHGLTVVNPSNGTYVQLDHINGTVSGSIFSLFRYNQSVIGSITQNGTSQVSFNISSDYRLKEDLQDFKGLDMVSKIPVYDFKWKTDESRSYGVMAHELQEVLPDAVTGEKDAEEMQGVDYSKIVPLLVKAIQELKAEIDELKK